MVGSSYEHGTARTLTGWQTILFRCRIPSYAHARELEHGRCIGVKGNRARCVLVERCRVVGSALGRRFGYLQIGRIGYLVDFACVAGAGCHILRFLLAMTPPIVVLGAVNPFQGVRHGRSFDGSGPERSDAVRVGRSASSHPVRRDDERGDEFDVGDGDRDDQERGVDAEFVGECVRGDVLWGHDHVHERRGWGVGDRSHLVLGGSRVGI